jgi:hypothetical protein
MRRTKATLIYRRTKNLRAVQLLLGHTKAASRNPKNVQPPIGYAGPREAQRSRTVRQIAEPYSLRTLWPLANGSTCGFTSLRTLRNRRQTRSCMCLANL